MKVLFVAAECYPFAKVGGLADVIGSLPQELVKIGCDARVIMPKYKTIKAELLEGIEKEASYYVFLGTKSQQVDLYKLVKDGVTYYFIDHEKFDRDKIYDFPDEAERWALFQTSVIESFKYSGFRPDVVNCNDWHTGMIPQVMKAKYFREYGSIKTVFTIHNIAFQGVFDRQVSKLFNMSFDNVMEFDNKMNFMKSAIVSSDYVNTVSETYANELLTSDYFSMGLGNILNQKAKKYEFGGILNGIDYTIWNPETDKCLPMNYNFSNYKEGKLLAKEELYKKLGVDFYSNVPLIAMCTRLTRQKGLDLIKEIAEELLKDSVFKFVIIGTGEKDYEEFFMDLEKRHPYKVKCYIGYSDELARLAYAASDMFLMPSQFEPCGLGQMIALRYGSLPIVRETGGLKDTVIPYNEYEMTGNGFSFTYYNSHDMLYVIKYAFRTYSQQHCWDVLVENAMNSDYSFKESAKKYYRIYKKLLDK